MSPCILNCHKCNFAIAIYLGGASIDFQYSCLLMERFYISSGASSDPPFSDPALLIYSLRKFLCELQECITSIYYRSKESRRMASVGTDQNYLFKRRHVIALRRTAGVLHRGCRGPRHTSATPDCTAPHSAGYCTRVLGCSALTLLPLASLQLPALVDRLHQATHLKRRPIRSHP